MAKKSKKIKSGKKLLKAQKPTAEDLARKSKRTGYRFKTDHLKKKNGEPTKLAKKLRFKKPTVAEIEKYKKNPDGSYPYKEKEIYHERRADRKHSDDNLRKKFEDGGDVKKGWLAISEVKEKLGRNLHFWNDDIVIINGEAFEKVFLQPFYKPVVFQVDEVNVSSPVDVNTPPMDASLNTI